MSLNHDQFYGKGIESVFPEGAGPVRDVPFPRAGRSKTHQDYDPEIVKRALVSQPKPVQIDPRMLQSTQPSVTSPGVHHYADGGAEAEGRLYADQASPGNRYPVVYSRFNSDGSKVDHMLLSGHHRATAALVNGRDLTAIHIEGPMGPPRQS